MRYSEQPICTRSKTVRPTPTLFLSLTPSKLTMLDRDKLLSNDHVGDAGFMVADLMADMQQWDGRTGSYGEENMG